MYNENAKNEFIDTLPMTMRSQSIKLFDMIEGMEVALGKDLAEFSKEESISAVNRLGYSNSQYESVNQYVVNIKRYKKWYAKTYHKDFAFSELDFSAQDADLSEAFRDQMIYTINEITGVPYENKPENGCCLLPILVLLFHGLDRDNIVKLEREDVSFVDSIVTVHFGGTKCRITDPVSVKILRDYDQFTEGETAIGARKKRLQTSKFIYGTKRFTSVTETFQKSKDLTEATLSSNVNYYRGRISDETLKDKTQIQNVKSSGLYRKIIDVLSNPEIVDLQTALREFINETRGKNVRKLNYDLIRWSVRDYMKAFEKKIRDDYGDRYDAIFQVVSE